MTVEDHTEAVDRLVRKVDQLHSGPKVAQRLLSLTRDPDFEMREVVECLEHDPALSARLLKVVNSSRYGLSHAVSSLRHAASFLGRRSLRQIVLTFALVETLTRGAKGALYSDYWRRSLTMATVSARLSRMRSDVAEDDAYTAGLLADVGILVLAQMEADRYLPVYENSPHSAGLVEVEQDTFGFGHPLLGARLLTNWGVPVQVVSAVEHHHERFNAFQPLDVTVHAGDLVADALWVSESTSVAAAREYLEKHFDLNLDGFIDLAVACREDIEESASIFGVELSTSVSCEQLLATARQLHSEVSLETAIELDSLETAVEELSS